MVRENLRIGIVGGQGKMGSWFVKLLRKKGYRVLVSDLRTKTSNAELVQKSDVVIFSVPINQTVMIIESLLSYSRTDQLWLDLTSIKVPPIQAMLRSKAEVLGCHPVFGPTVSSLQDQTLVVCPARVEKWSNWWENLLEEEGAKIKITHAQKHDEIMAIVQGLTHFSAITISYALQELGVDIAESLDYTSPVYRIHLDMEGRILAQNPELYADIQLMNPAIRETLLKYIQSAGKLFQIIEQKDRNAFMHYFGKAADHLGDFKKHALHESDELIRLLVKSEE